METNLVKFKQKKKFLSIVISFQQLWDKSFEATEPGIPQDDNYVL